MIGITADFAAATDLRLAPRQEPTVFLPQRYCREVEKAGGLAIILPPTDSISAADRYLEQLTGLVISGGNFDIDPRYYGEAPIEQLGAIVHERTEFELTLARRALRRDVPILGICGGAQAINVAMGGSLYQDIGAQLPHAGEHQLSAQKEHGGHRIRIQPETLLAKAIGRGSVEVNTTHHQAIKALGKGLAVNALSEDGLIEGVESVRHTFVLGVQWHPEVLAPRRADQRRIFSLFVAAEAAITEDRGRAQIAGRRAAAAEELFYDRITVGITRLRADVGMHRPAPQNAFTLHAGFFHDAGRGGVIDITDRPHPVNIFLPECPADELLHGFGHVAFAPVRPRENEPSSHFSPLTRAIIMPITCFVFGPLDRPVIGLADIPREQTHAHILQGLIETTVGAPTDIAGDFRILRVPAKNRLSIRKFYFSQSQAFSFECFGWRCHSRRVPIKFMIAEFRVPSTNIQELPGQRSRSLSKKPHVGGVAAGQCNNKLLRDPITWRQDLSTLRADSLARRSLPGWAES